MKHIKARGGEKIKVDSDQYAKLNKYTWYVYDKKPPSQKKQIVNCKGESIAKVMFKHIWTDSDFSSYRKLGDPLDCQSRQYVLNNCRVRVSVYCTEDERNKWHEAAGNKSLSSYIAETMNKRVKK